MLSTREFAERTGLTEEEVIARILKRRIKALTVKGTWRISEDPDKWLANNEPNKAKTTNKSSDQNSEGASDGSQQDASSRASTHHMTAISDKAISRIKAVFETSFKDVLDRLKTHAESLPSDMRQQLSKEVTSQFKEHANKYSKSFDDRVNSVIEHIIKLESKISDDKLNQIEKGVSELLKTQLSEVILDQYFKARENSSWEKLQDEMKVLTKIPAIEKSVSDLLRTQLSEETFDQFLNARVEIYRKDLLDVINILTMIPAIENRIEAIEGQIGGLSTKEQQEVIQGQLASASVLGDHTRRYLKLSFIGIGIVAVVSIVNLVLAL